MFHVLRDVDGAAPSANSGYRGQLSGQVLAETRGFPTIQTHFAGTCCQIHLSLVQERLVLIFLIFHYFKTRQCIENT